MAWHQVPMVKWLELLLVLPVKKTQILNYIPLAAKLSVQSFLRQTRASSFRKVLSKMVRNPYSSVRPPLTCRMGSVFHPSTLLRSLWHGASVIRLAITVVTRDKIWKYCCANQNRNPAKRKPLVQETSMTS